MDTKLPEEQETWFEGGSGSCNLSNILMMAVKKRVQWNRSDVYLLENAGVSGV